MKKRIQIFDGYGVNSVVDDVNDWIERNEHIMEVLDTQLSTFSGKMSGVKTTVMVTYSLKE